MDFFTDLFSNHQNIKKIILITLSSLLYSIAMNTFVEFGNLFPGGISGITRLITQSSAKYLNFNISFGTIYFLLNIIIALFFGKRVGKQFMWLSILWFSETSLFTNLLPSINVTNDIILISIFGGIISGFGNSIALNQDASSGGFDFIAMYFSSRYGISTWSYVFAFNCIVLIVAGTLFGWDKALYSIIYQFVYTQVINMMHERYRHLSLFIITRNPIDIERQIYTHTTHSCTKFWGEGGFAHQKECLVLTTITQDEYYGLVRHIKQVDPKCFIIVNTTDKIVGRFIQRTIE